MLGAVRRRVRLCVDPGFALRVAAVALGAAALASCAAAPPKTAAKATKSKEYFSTAEYGPASPRVIAETQPVPKGGGRYMVGEPYTVAGKTYKPKDDPLYSKVGLASWYGDAFHGRLTANGEVYDVGALTAAHPTMPLPSYARVTNLANNRSVIVRVNDRGPFKHGRIIDVSANVAGLLDFKRSGTAKVKVDYVGPAQMEGHDQQMLLASYREGGQAVEGPTVALAKAPKARPVLAAFAKPRKKLPVDRFEVFEEAPDQPAAFVPAIDNGEDQLGPLILRNGFASSYAGNDEPTAAHAATAAMASRAVVQLGVFGDPRNAAKAGKRFGSYGKVTMLDVGDGERTFRAVRVAVDTRKVAPEAVIAAANAAGLGGAYLVSP